MHRIVLDTNVLVSALLTPQGPPARVFEGSLEGRWETVVTPEILEEYAIVLRRPHLGLSAPDAREALASLQRVTVAVFPQEPVRACSDPDDDKFLSCALAGAATHLVTGNLRDFPKGSFSGTLIVSPAEFLRAAL